MLVGSKNYYLYTVELKVTNTRPSLPVRQDGERQTTFLAEYAFRRVLFSRFGSFYFFTLILFNLPKFIDAIINNTRCACHQ